MAILQLHRIQHSVCVLLVFLIHFSSLQFPSHGYTVPDKYFNNCGSDSSASKSGKNYVGESNLKTSFGSSNTERSESQVPSPLYQTAKKFRSEASGYKFNINVAPTWYASISLLSLRLVIFPRPGSMFRYLVSGCCKIRMLEIIPITTLL